MNRASATQRSAAAELGSRHAELVAYDPQQRCVWLGLDRHGATVDIEFRRHDEILFWEMKTCEN
jgi:hypothetical protein